jgi:hypothetical protein
LASFVLLGIGVVATWPGPKEPEYNGKTLSQWLLYKPTASEATNAFEIQSEAIRQIGEPAVPWLLKWVRYESPAWRRKLVRFLGRDRRVERSNAVWFAFRILGPKAAAAIPELTSMINNPNGPEFYGKPLLALAAMGERGFPPVLAVVETPAHINRATAARIIGETAEWGTNRLRAVPALVSCLNDKEFMLVAAAESSLGNIAKDKNLQLPVLAEKLAAPATNHLAETVDSLAKFVVSQKAPERLRLASTMALASLGPRAKEAVPALVRTLKDDNQVVQSAATNALRKIAPGKDF